MPHLVIQLGHTGRPPHPGSRGTAGEQDFVRRAGAACHALIHGRGGWTVALIQADESEALYRGDAFIALHGDGSLIPESRGASLGYQSTPGRQLAHAVRDAYTRLGWPGGWKPDNYTSALAYYYGVRNALNAGNPQAFIFECGTLTNDRDRAELEGPHGPARVAAAIARGLGVEDSVELDDYIPYTHPSDNTTHHVTVANTLTSTWFQMFFDSQYGPGVAPTLRTILDRLSALPVELVTALGRDPQFIAGVSAALAQDIAQAVADELDRRARDSDSATGPTT